jgi:hypothetical protein
MPLLVPPDDTHRHDTLRHWAAVVRRRRWPGWVDEYGCDHLSHWVQAEALTGRAARAYLRSRQEAANGGP